MKIGMAMIPSVEMIESIVELQKKVIPICPLHPLLGTENNLPHITLVQGQFGKHINWVSLISKLRDYCHKQKYLLEVKVTGLEYKPLGWYFLTLNENILFYEAHRCVFEELKDSMFLTKEDLRKDTDEYTLLEKYNYCSYGYRFIGDAFKPHITLGRSIDKSQCCNKANLIPLVESFTSSVVGTIQKITLYEMGDNGCHAATLYSLEI